MEAAPSDAAGISVPTGTGVTATSLNLQSETHSRPIMDDIEEISVQPAYGPSTSSPQPLPQARRSMRRTSRTTRSSYAGSVTGESQGATRTRPDQPASPQRREVATSPTPLGQAQGRPSIYARVRAFLGHGNPSRRRIVHTVFSVTLYLSQIVISAVFIALTQIKWRSQSAKSRGGIGHLSEWDACDKPLGSMMIVWLVRCILGVLLTFWSFKRSIMMCVLSMFLIPRCQFQCIVDALMLHPASGGKPRNVQQDVAKGEHVVELLSKPLPMMRRTQRRAPLRNKGKQILKRLPRMMGTMETHPSSGHSLDGTKHTIAHSR
jgi:hypothetical protein